MARPKVSDWKADESVLRAGTRGFNILDELPLALQKAFPWLKEFEFGFFIDEHVPHRTSIGWAHLKKSHLEDGVDEFNQAIGLRFGLTTDGTDNLMWRENYIMIMPNEFRAKLWNIRHKMDDEQMARNVGGGAFIPPGAKQAQEEWIREQSQNAYETATVVNRAGTEDKQPKPRGRPPKNKDE